MASKFEYFQGKAKWARTTTPDPWNNYKITLYMDKDSDSLTKFQALKEKGLKTELKKDEDGYYATFKRPTQKLMRGKITTFTPPAVVLADGTPLTDGLIGNGSDVTVKVVVYNYTTPQKVQGVAVRLESIRVDNLVPFESNRDFQADQATAVQGLSDQPAPTF